ncbi:MAG: LD-carboxypeptidase [Ignavibacteria bacterium]|nr:LD-carboxypeptidase [Ignavibacteria bacterium]
MSSVATAAVAPLVVKSSFAASSAAEASYVAASASSAAVVLPTQIQRGSKIGIACPSSSATTQELEGFVQLCLAQGLTPVLGRNINKRSGYLSASDQDRADELMEFVDDASVHAIVCARGGYGVMRILPMLDYSAIRHAGKVIMGFSDITALLIAANQLSGIVTFHGPVASSTFDEFTINGFTKVVMPSIVQMAAHSADAVPAPFIFQDDRITTFSGGLGRGRLTGGNLSMIVSTLGTKYEIDTTNAILFLEEINEEPFRIDRMLTQLWLAGKLQTCKGIVMGNFRNCEAKGLSITGPSFTLQQVIEQRTGDLGIPVVYGLPFGHVRSKLTLPIGIEAEIDASKKSLRFLSVAVT